ncbi:MAG: succinate dehydrogenase iron-sulfur subunit [Deltaproteobacteria bacterium]|nr:succinate dehydrogenase iron-sulfur subunit [Deltaproteobacteria bacterium]
MKRQDVQERIISVYIHRFDPTSDKKPRAVLYELAVEQGMTVLDGLHRIKETQDPTLAFRFSCRMGVCGSCAMLINGKPMLACNTQILDVTDKALTVAPLPNFRVVRDLVPDLAPLFKKHVQVNPYIVRTDGHEMESPSGEFIQTPEELIKYLQFTYCIKCGACVAACPTAATDENYLGPMALAQAYRYIVDSRDDGFHSRKSVVGADKAVFNCHYAGECSAVCPKGVDPARAIQFMKRELVRDYLLMRRHTAPLKARALNDKSKEKKTPLPVPPYTVDR